MNTNDFYQFYDTSIKYPLSLGTGIMNIGEFYALQKKSTSRNLDNFTFKAARDIFIMEELC